MRCWARTAPARARCSRSWPAPKSPDAGAITFDGAPVRLASPHAAQELGIVTIYQEFNLIPTLSVAENVFIGRLPVRLGRVDWAVLHRRTKALTEEVGLGVDPRRLVSDLSVAEQQMVEIARALSRSAKLVVMDEPTSALSDKEVQRLFAIVRGLKAKGISVVFVTHRLEEVLQICDHATVLRDGALAGTAPIAELDVERIIRLMVGREIDRLFAHREGSGSGAVALAVEGVSRARDARDPHAVMLHDISLEVRKGEILGLAGLVGAGRTELARAIFGADPMQRGRVLVDGHEVAIRSPIDAIRAGIGLVPEDRKQQALFLSLAIRNNLSVTSMDRLVGALGLLRRGEEDALVESFKQQARHPHGERRPGRGQPLRRQSAEGGARPLAGAAAQGADRRRAHPRHRRRRQGRGPLAPLRARRHRYRHPGDLVRAARDPDHQRPHRHHARGPGHGRGHARRGQRGAPDAADGAGTGGGRLSVAALKGNAPRRPTMLDPSLFQSARRPARGRSRDRKHF